MARDEETTEEIAFDELPSILEDDIVVLLGTDGQPRELVMLAVVGWQDREYALLGRRDDLESDVDGDLIVARFDAAQEGPARFTNVEDESELAGVREVLGDLVELG